MSKAEWPGKAQTVLGIIDGRNLGITLPHEHLLIHGKALFREPSDVAQKAYAYESVTLSNLSWLRYHPFENLDNLQLLDEDVAAREVALFKKAGGNTIVDVTTIGLGRDPKALERISTITGINVMMGTGYYFEPSLDSSVLSMEEAEIADLMMQEIICGIENTEIKAGIIGEIGCSWPLTDFEKEVLRAAATVQKHTGLAISIHPGRSSKAPFEIIRVLEKAGAEINKVAICHIDGRIRNGQQLRELIRTGCYVEYDLWGWEGYFPSYLSSDGFLDLPNDAQRIQELLGLISEGYINQILISHDVNCKSKLVSYGGWGYAHILDHAVPSMFERGITREQVVVIMRDNPRRFLCCP
jgi:phosphotriesterase-related protein